jgi:hypothetical protein
MLLFIDCGFNIYIHIRIFIFIFIYLSNETPLIYALLHLKFLAAECQINTLYVQELILKVVKVVKVQILIFWLMTQFSVAGDC